MATIRGGVREFARAHGASKALLIDLALAVTEAVTNCVVHAYVDRGPGTIRTSIQAGPDELIVTVTDDGRGMQPRADSPGLGLGLPTIASLTTSMDMHAPPGGGTAITMTFAAPGVHGPVRAASRAPELLEQVTRTVDGTWPGEGVERLVDLLVPDLADACALDAMDASGQPQRFAGRIDGPDGARQSAWLASLKPRTDAPQSAARQALDDGGVHVSELTREHIARITFSTEDAEQMEATGVRWWVAVPLNADGRRLGLLGFGLRSERGEPSAELLELYRAVGDRAARALLTTQLISDLRRTRERFARHPRGARRGRDRAGRGRADGVRQHGRGAARRLRDAGGAARHVRDRADRALRDHRRRRQPGRLRGPARRPAAGRARRAAAADPLAPPRVRNASCGC